MQRTERGTHSIDAAVEVTTRISQYLNKITQEVKEELGLKTTNGPQGTASNKSVRLLAFKYDTPETQSRRKTAMAVQISAWTAVSLCKVKIFMHFIT